LANILLGAAISIAGMSVAFPVGIGLALVVGVIVNYIDAPIGNSTFIFVGVALIVIAILLNANAYRKMLAGNTASVSTKGLALSVISGLLMGLFYKYVANSMFPDFTHPVDGKLSPYTAVVFFAVGIFLSNFIFNTFLMKKPFLGAPVSYSDYFKGTSQSHLMGIVGGSIWCIGMSFNIIASGTAGQLFRMAWDKELPLSLLFGVFISGKNSRMLHKEPILCLISCCCAISLAGIIDFCQVMISFLLGCE
jgi:glucose uptake protein